MMRWISAWKRDGAFHNRRPLQAFAFRMSLRASAMALAASILLLPALRQAGLVSATGRDLVTFSLISAVLTGAMGGLMALRSGRTILRLAQSSARFERLSRLDDLSGLLNRRAFSEAFSIVPPGSSLVILDVDRFKSINDTFGHASGDAVIRRVSALIGNAVEPGDHAGRLGGEEFGLLLTGGTVTERVQRIDVLRQKIGREDYGFDLPGFRVSISAGMSETGPDRSTELVYASADKALYLAKASGRNRVVHDLHGLNVILDMVAANGVREAEEQDHISGVA